MPKVGILLIACIIVLVMSFPAEAQVYRWRDKDGNLVVSDSPPPPWIKAEQQRVGESSGAGLDSTPVRDVDMVRRVSDVKVVMYMTDWCPACRKARQYLNSLGVELTEYNVEKDPEKAEEWNRKCNGRKAVPLIDIEGATMLGLNPSWVKKTLEEKRRTGLRY